MLGIVFGTICLILLVRVLARPRWGGWYGSRHGRHGRGPGPRAFLWRLLRRIDATPAQEKVFRDEVASLRDGASGLREELRASGRDLAAALRDETLDPQKLAAIHRKHDELLTRLRERLSASLARVHSTLDARQRDELASLLERGGHAGCC